MNTQRTQTRHERNGVAPSAHQPAAMIDHRQAAASLRNLAQLSAHSPRAYAQRKLMALAAGNMPAQLAGFLIADGQAPGAGQMSKADFLQALRGRVNEVAQFILGPFGMARADCPDLQYWLARYDGMEVEHVEKVIARYAPDTAGAKDAAQYLDLLVARIETGLVEHTQSGKPVDPEPAPAELNQQRPGLNVFGIQRKAVAPVQLNCAKPEFVPEPTKIITEETPALKAITEHIGDPGDKHNKQRVCVDLAKELAKIENWDDLSAEKQVERSALALGYDPARAAMLGKKEKFTKESIPEHTGKPTSNGIQSFATQDDDLSLSVYHQVLFDNKYEEDGTWTMNFNFKNPYLTAFYASDVNDVQAEKCGVGKNAAPAQIIRHNVMSENGKEWKARHGLTESKNLKKYQLQDFISNTDNGIHSADIAKKRGVRISAGRFEQVSGSWDVILTCVPI